MKIFLIYELEEEYSNTHNYDGNVKKLEQLDVKHQREIANDQTLLPSAKKNVSN